VHRSDAGAITFAAQYEQADYAQEQLDDATSAELQAFLTAAFKVVTPKPSPREWLERLSADRQEAITDAVFAAGGAARLWYVKALGSPQIDVTAPETQGGVNAMAAAGIITQDEANTLLAQ